MGGTTGAGLTPHAEVDFTEALKAWEAHSKGLTGRAPRRASARSRWATEAQGEESTGRGSENPGVPATSLCQSSQSSLGLSFLSEE